MSIFNKQDLLISINNAVSIIVPELGKEVVNSVFEKHHAHDLSELNDSDLLDVFNELYAIEEDIR